MKPPLISLSLACIVLNACQPQPPARTEVAEGPVWESAEYALYRDRVVQGPHEARALSATELTSNYQSPANAFQSPEVVFKFSFNGKDNEMAPGQDHKLLALPAAAGGTVEPPPIVFGRQYVDAAPVPANTYLAPNTRVKIRLDLRAVLADFKKQGYFTTYKGEKLFKEDFKQVFVAGNTAPLSWDFDNLVNKPELELKDPDGDGIYEVTLTLNQPRAAKTTAGRWQQSLNTADFPQYQSDFPLADALYNLALEEARRAVEPDSTFRTGQEWAGVWTRDISYSIILAQALLQPKVAMNSLLRKVSPEGRIIQDTGTGGAYPCSTDRMIWAVAAWEIYTVTGDEAWLKRVYPIIKKSVEDDVQNAYDPNSRQSYVQSYVLKPGEASPYNPANRLTHLVRGESSFLDWREQTYPRWMQPVDIYQSETLGTNAVHYQANQVLALMAERLGLGKTDAAGEPRERARRIASGINGALWLADKGYYGQFRYGRVYHSVSPRAEALGEALSVLFGVADAERARSVVAKTPTTAYGISCIYPQIPGIPPYHNNAVWPFVQSFWALAAAKAGNEASVTESMAAIYRPAALFLTNKENFVAENGDFAGTQINSSNMLWSLSGSLSLVYKVLFGMEFQADRLVLRPFVPQAFAGTRRLANFRYRGAVLDLELRGFGNQIKRITLDGQPLAGAAVPATLTGRHAVRIELSNVSPPAAGVNRVANAFTPETPVVRFNMGYSSSLQWAVVPGAESYRLFVNGKLSREIPAAAATAAAEKSAREAVPAAGAVAQVMTPFDARAQEYAEYQVVAVGKNGLSSFASEPLELGAWATSAQRYQLEDAAPQSTLPYKGYTGAGFVETSLTINPTLTIPVSVAEVGLYAIDFRYANGNGPINTENKCAIRSLRRDKNFLGTIVLPQRGVAEWSNWGYTNAVLLRLTPGRHVLQLTYEPANANMNGVVNQAMLDYLRLRRVE